MRTCVVYNIKITGWSWLSSLRLRRTFDRWENFFLLHDYSFFLLWCFSVYVPELKVVWKVHSLALHGVWLFSTKKYQFMHIYKRLLIRTVAVVSDGCGCNTLLLTLASSKVYATKPAGPSEHKADVACSLLTLQVNYCYMVRGTPVCPS